MARTVKTTVHKGRGKSKTQQAYEGALAGDPAALDVLIGMCIVKCRGLWPPFSTDHVGASARHRYRRRWTNRYTWIRNWLMYELYNVHVERDPDETGGRLVQRCKWRLIDAIRRDRNARKEPKTPKRVRRADYPAKAFVVEYLSTLPEIEDPVLRDLWERILDAYPDWKYMTNDYLAGITGVHPNTLASRRKALAILQQRDASSMQIGLLERCLRLTIGKVRKTDIHRIEAQTGSFDRQKLAAKTHVVGHRKFMDWKTGGPKRGLPAEGVPVFVPILSRTSPPTDLRPYKPPPRCPHIDRGGIQCTNAAKVCSIRGHKPTI